MDVHTKVFCLIIVATFGFPSGGSVRAEEHSTATLDDILTAWKKRDESVRTLRCTWTATSTMRAGSLPDVAASDPKKPRQVPPEEVTLSTEHLLLIDGAQVRHRATGQTWYLGKKEQRLKTYTADSVTDGREARRREVDADTSREHAFVYESSSLGIQSDMMGNPLFWYMHPLASVFDKDTKGQLAETTVSEQDAGIIRVQQRSSDNVPLIFDIDSRQNYHIVRLIKMRDEEEAARLTIDYEPHELHGYIPKHWSLVSFDADGRERAVRAARVTSFELNVPLTKKDFHLSFTPGTIVRAPGRSFVANSVGEPVPPGSERENDPYRWLLLGLTLLIVGVVILILQRRSRTSR
jgi:hypothetical protein